MALAGECYSFGKGVQIDLPKAVAFLQEAAAMRDLTEGFPAERTSSRLRGKSFDGLCQLGLHGLREILAFSFIWSR
jgi:hypothetical protein